MIKVAGGIFIKEAFGELIGGGVAGHIYSGDKTPGWGMVGGAGTGMLGGVVGVP